MSREFLPKAPDGTRLKEARLKLGISQKDLGIRSGMEEFSSSARINQYERHKHIPDYVIPGTDQYDATICALMAAVFSGASNQLKLPELVKFQPEFDPREGWIYGLPANYVSQYQL